jgi:hypothetical protein
MMVIFFLCLCALSYSEGAACHASNATYGPTNDFPIFDGDSNLQFIRSVPNGKLYQVNVPNSGPGTNATFSVVHVWGTGYEMGYAQGSLFKDIAPQFINNVWSYLESQITNGPYINDLPKWLADLIADLGLDAALEATELLTRPYTPSYFFDEFRGFADASGSDYQRIVNVHMIASLTQGKCSMFGAWGKALDPTSSTKLLQLRALDWDMSGPFRDVPSITVYHPAQGNSFVMVGIAGFMVALTGVSDKKLGISEIGVAYPDSSFGSESRIGYPFLFLLRDILQWDLTIDDATNRMINAKRTCDLILGVGDGKSSQFRGYEYSSSVLNIFDDANLQPLEDWHPRIPNIVYWGMDWLCPTDNTVLSHQLLSDYGKLTPEVAIKNIVSVEESGDNHSAFYDLTNLIIYVSFAAPHNVSGPVAGYARQFTKLDVNLLLAEKPPTSTDAEIRIN